jgi:Domain of unknown function (DUF927)
MPVFAKKYKSQADEIFVSIKNDYADYFGPMADLNLASRRCLSTLSAVGISTSSKAAIAELSAAIDAVDYLHPIIVADRPGWCDAGYALRSGEVIGSSESEVRCLFQKQGESKCGEMQPWLDLADLVKNNALPNFAITAPLVAPLLALLQWNRNIFFDFAGDSGTFMDTLEMLSASVVGHPHGTLVPLAEFLPKAQAIQDAHRDGPLIIGDTSFAAHLPKSKKDTLLQVMAFDLQRPENGRTCAMSYGERPILSFISDRYGAKEFASRIITIPVSADSPHGKFKALPKGFVSAQAFHDHIRQTLLANHGHALYLFVDRLASEQKKDPEALLATIQGHIDVFRRKANADLEQQPISRVVDAFGLVYAAGKLAIEYGCLPPDRKIGPKIFHCYQSHQAQHVPVLDIADQIAALVKLAKTSAELTASGSTLSKVGFMINKTKGELVIHKEAIGRLIKGWPWLKSDPATKQLLKLEKGHLGRKRRGARNEKPDRHYVFDLNAIAEEKIDDSEANGDGGLFGSRSSSLDGEEPTKMTAIERFHAMRTAQRSSNEPRPNGPAPKSRPQRKTPSKKPAAKKAKPDMPKPKPTRSAAYLAEQKKNQL